MNEAEPRSANARVDLARFPELLVTDLAIEPIVFTYQFLLSDGRIWSFEVRLDPLTLKQIHSPRAIPPRRLDTPRGVPMCQLPALH